MSIRGINPAASAAEELRRLQQGAIGGAQPCESLVITDLSLRQGHDRLEIEIDAAWLDRLADGRDHLAAVDNRSLGGCGRGRAAAAGDGLVFVGRNVELLAGKFQVVERDRLGKLFHQRPEFRDFGADASVAVRVCSAAASMICHCGSPGPRFGGPFGHLMGQVGSAAGQVGDLAADVKAVAQPSGDGVVDRKPGQHRDRNHHRFGGLKTGQQVERRADRGGDQDHANDNKNGTQPRHGRFPRPMHDSRDHAQCP